MVSGYIITSLVISACLIILGLLVYIRNPKSSLNKLFFVFSVSASLWLVTNYLGGDPNLSHRQALIANKLLFLFIGIGVFALLLFVRKLVNRKSPKTLYLLTNVLIIASTLTPLIVANVKLQNDTYSINFGILSTLFFLTLLINCIYAITTLLNSRSKARGMTKLQIDTILISIAVAITGIFITNALLPFLFKYYGATNIGSFLSSFAVIGIGFTVVRHKLFDIKLAVAKSIAYVLTLSIVAILYIVPLVVLTKYVTHIHLTKSSIAILVIVTFIAAVIFWPLSRAFGKLSNRIFYRDYYDIQDVLDRLGKLLVGSVDSEEIKAQGKHILTEAINPTYFDYLLPAEKSEHESYELFKALIASRMDLIILDELSDDIQIKQIMMKNNIGAAVRLRAKEEVIGFMLLGYKLSGQIFSDTDKRLLAIASAEMAVGLKNAFRFEEIQSFNFTLQEKIKEATYRLRKTNDKLRALDEAKDDFVSMASHQLRTPLTSVKGNISMVIDGDAGNITSVQKQLLDQAYSSSQRMVFLISDLLNVSRLKTGKFVIERTPIDLAKVVEEEVNQLIDTAKSRNLELKYEKPNHIAELMLDDAKTRQVIMNFIDNAIYYTPSGGKIDVVLSETSSAVECRVIDNGIGVPKHEQHHLFTKFYRAGNARKARPDGTGLGLFMAKKVIISEGGSLIFETEEGKGSTFGFSFPKKSLEVAQ